MYARDNDDRYAPYANGTGAVNSWNSYFPYFKSLQVLRCPSAPAYTGLWEPLNNSVAVYGMPFSSSTSVITPYINQANPLNLPYLGPDAVPEASRTGIIIETARGTYPTNGAGAPNVGYTYAGGANIYNKATATGATAYYMLDRHLEGSNFGYADGHVKWLKKEVVESAWKTADSYVTGPPQQKIPDTVVGTLPIIFAWRR
jgi:prepilin-type processing-associated H-X9-DG protein